jgi:cytochrome c oxidase subunit III
MATTVHEPPEIKSRPALSHDGGWRDLPPSTGDLLTVEDSSPASRAGIWVALAAISMTFVAITSAMVVRQGASMDWRHFNLPPVLYLNTVILLASSVTLELARKRVATFARLGVQPGRSLPLLWLWVTLGLGLLFVGGQYTAWLQLKAEGWYLATNPSSSFFYLFTAMHGLHVLGGLAGLTLVIWRFTRPVSTLRLSTLSTVSYYWHFMDVLWIYLLLLLLVRI